MKSMMKLSAIASVLALAGALAFSGHVMADQVKANYSGVLPDPAGTVKFTLGGTTKHVYAGVMSFGNATDGAGGASPIMTYGTNQFVSFCIDLRDEITPQTTEYTWDVVSLASAPNPPGGSMTQAKADRLAKLLGGVLGTSLNNATNFAAYNGVTGTLSDAQKAAALQIAVWMVVYDGISFSNNAIAIQQATTQVNNLNTYTAMNGLVGLTSPTSAGTIRTQDFIGQVPIPAAAWLFVSALIGVAALGRRRRKGAEDNDTLA